MPPSASTPLDSTTSSATFESFPSLVHSPDEDSIGTKIKRFFLPATTTSAPPPPPPPSSFHGSTPGATTTLRDHEQLAGNKPDGGSISALETLTQLSAAPASSRATSRRHSRQNSAALAPLSTLPPTATAGTTITNPIPLPDAGTTTAQYDQDVVRPMPVPLPLPGQRRGRHGSMTGPRPLRLSGVSPSVRLTVANSDKGDLVQSASSRSLYGDAKYAGSDGYGPSAGLYGSPGGVSAGGAASEFGGGLANLSTIPGFPLGRDAADDSRSIRSLSTVARPSASVAHVIRKIRGEGLSTDYWIKDESSKECFDCQMVFTAFRRKHHCRICGQIFCSRCASNIISSARFGQQGFVRVCNLCLSVLEHRNATQDDSHVQPRMRPSLRQSLIISAPIEASARPPLSQFAASQLFPRNESPYQAQSEAEFDRISEGGSSRRETPSIEDAELREDGLSPGAMSPTDLMSTVLSGSSPPTVPVAIAPFRRNMAEEDKTEGADGLGIATDNIADDSTTTTVVYEGMPSSPVGVPPPSIASGHKYELEGATPRPPIEHVLSTSASILAEHTQTQDTAAPEGPNPPRIAAPALLAAPVTTLSPAQRGLGNDRALSSRLSPYDTTHTPVVIYPELPPEEGDYEKFLVDAAASQQSGFNLQQPTWDRIPLAQASIEHIRTMLRQSLMHEGVANPKTWETVLLSLLLRVAENLQPDARAGDDIDVRAYVHVKKIPGGHPRDTEYVDGVVFTKNVMHKKMDRSMSNPRIMLLTLPLEYQRVENQLMSLDPLLKQEKEYLFNLVQRISALRPHILLVEKNVSRLALEFLMANRIAVARNVKREAIESVSRATQADIVSSIDKLALEPRLGRCKTFRVQTFVHSMIPGRRKTFMRFEGCGKDLGCTILLRGGPMDVLAKIKKIIDHMILVVYNAKLEGYLFRDEILYARHDLPAVAPKLDRRQASDGSTSTATGGVRGGNNILSGLQVPEQERISRDVARALKPYETTALSGSAFVHFPPPYPLARMSEEDRRVKALRKLREYEETEQILSEEAEASSKQLEHATISASSSTTSLRSLSLDRSASLAAATISTAPSSVVDGSTGENSSRPREDPLKVLQTPTGLARSTEFVEAEERHAELLSVWDAYLATSRDSLDPIDHQHIFVLEAKVIIVEEKEKGSNEDRGTMSNAVAGEKTRVCSPPTMRRITFYGDNDCSLGQFIERSYREMGKLCEAVGCGRHNLAHHRTWVHGDLRLLCIPEAHHFGIDDRSELGGRIVMFSSCSICGARSGQTAMSEETYHISFGKYLQLSFYGAHDGLTRADGLCEHNPRTEHQRYFNFRGITFRFCVEPIDLRNVVPPPRVLKIKPETQLELRNEEYMTVLKRSNAFWDSIVHRIASFNYDLVQADRLDECRQAMVDLSAKCESDRRAITKMLESTYEHASATNGTEMTSVRRALQNKAVDWEAEWTSFEQRIIPSEKDVRRLTTVQLKRLFSNDGVPLSPERKVTGPSLPPSIEAEEKEEGDTITEKSIMPKLDAPSSSTSGGTTPLSLDIFGPALPPSDQPLPPPALKLPPSSSNDEPSDEDNASDSTVCAEPGAQIPSPYMFRRRSIQPDDTSGGESEASAPARRGRPGQSIAQLVDMFSKGSDAPSSKRTESGALKSPTSSRPSLRRGQTEHKPRPKSRVMSKDILSDGDGSYARNVGVSHLSGQSQKAFAERPSRIPARKAPTKTTDLARLFDQESQPDPPSRKSSTRDRSISPKAKFSATLSTSPVQSRPGSRSASRSGRATPALSRNTSLEGSTITLKAARPSLLATSSNWSSRSSLAVKSKDISGESSESGKASKHSTSRDLGIGISRPTTSSISKASRRAVSQASGNRVSTIANHFNRLSRENERERQRKLALFRGKRARPVAVARSTVQVFDNVRDAAKEDSDDDGHHSSDGADDEDDDEHDVDSDADEAPRESRPVSSPKRSTRDVSVASSAEMYTYDGASSISMAEVLACPQLDAIPPIVLREDVDKPSTPPQQGSSDTAPPSVPPSPLLPDGFATLPRMSDAESSGTERGSLIKAITNLWAYRGGDFTPLEYPLAATEHIFADNPILVREDEPSSILAFTLSSKAYRSRIEEQSTVAPRVSERSEAFMPDDVHPTDRRSTWGLVDLAQMPEGTDAEDALRRPEAKHFRLQFEEGTTTFFCKIFFAEQFDALRRNCGCSNQFIESLARCVKWESSGGKSKVDFLKTKDDRFIIKEISRLEMDALLRFAPAYFEYMSKAIFQGLPTILAKIFGFYRIGLRNPTTGKVMRVDVLVMENLFYQRQLTQVFDLKGSTRNRMVDAKKRAGQVLMDENLVEMSGKNPFYIREDSKRLLRASIFNDSLFLSNLNVMDYSLVVGVDSVKQELVVGIVDFIRTYTWDKRLESWVKDTAFLGGGSSKPGGPTIITPKQYKHRFRDAMDGYFLLSPDPWVLPSSLIPVCSTAKDAKEKDVKEGYMSVNYTAEVPAADALKVTAAP